MDWIQRPPNPESDRYRRHHDVGMASRHLNRSTPFIINAFVGSRIFASILENLTRRQDVGNNLALHRDPLYPIFPIGRDVRYLSSEYPVPLVVTSVYGKLKAEKLGLVARPRRQGAASKDSSGHRNRMASSLKAWVWWEPSRTNESLGITRSCSVGV